MIKTKINKDLLEVKTTHTEGYTDIQHFSRIVLESLVNQWQDKYDQIVNQTEQDRQRALRPLNEAKENLAILNK